MPTTVYSDSVLKEAIRVLLSHPAGFGVDVVGFIGINRQEDGRFQVYDLTQDEESDEDDYLDSDLENAIEEFFRLRYEREAGLDYETATAD